MELPKEIIESNNLTEEQVTAISEFGANHEAEFKQAFEKEHNATANKNAQKIIGDAAKGVEKFTGFRSREEGERLEVYTQSAFESFASKEKDSMLRAKSEFNEKVKNFKGDEEIRVALNDLKGKHDALQEKEANFDEILNAGIPEKYNSLLAENEATKIDNAFASVMPTFPTGVNEYEKVGKWNEFKAEVLKNNNIVKVDKEFVAVDKTNPHKTIKLSKLVSNDGNIQGLLQGRQQNGLNLQKDFISLENVPFKVPVGIDSKERSKLIKEQLIKEGIDPVSDKGGKRFSELNRLILNKGA